MTQGRKTKSKLFTFVYREVLAIAPRRIDSYSLSLIEYSWSFVSLI